MTINMSDIPDMAHMSIMEIIATLRSKGYIASEIQSMLEIKKLMILENIQNNWKR